jgi:hypothetical protein
MQIRIPGSISAFASFPVASFLVASLFALVACGGGADVVHLDGGSADAGGPDARTECSDPEPPPTACDFFLSCGCNVAAGEKCSIDSNNSMRACFQAGDKAPGATCGDETECQAGSLCALFGGGNAMRCMQYCDPAHTCPSTPVAQACYIPVFNVVDARVCGQVCDLRGQDCELADQACYPASAVSTMEKGICARAAARVDGDPCDQGNDCAKGFTCISNPAPTPGATCHRMCSRDGSAPVCTVGTCKPLEGHTLTGICL